MLSSRPLLIVWDVTSKCNFNCIYCRRFGSEWELNTNNSKRLLEKAYNIVDDRGFITFSGGEPLVRKDLPELLKYSRELGLNRVIVVTNGSLLNENIMKLMKHYDIEVDITLNSISDQIYNEITGTKDMLRRVLRNVSKCIEYGILNSIITLILRLNSHEILDVLKYSIDRGVNSIIVDSLKPIGKGYERYNELALTPREYNELLEVIFKFQREHSDVCIYVLDPFYVRIVAKYNQIESIVNLREHYVCGCGLGRALYISSLGDIRPCAFFPYTYGNILHENEFTLWERIVQNKLMRNLADTTKLIGKCSKCEYKEICRGGCRVRAYMITGSWFYNDPLCNC